MTQSEQDFEKFLTENGIKFERIETEENKHKPDYLIYVPEPVVVEIAEIEGPKVIAEFIITKDDITKVGTPNDVIFKKPNNVLEENFPTLSLPNNMRVETHLKKGSMQFIRIDIENEIRALIREDDILKGIKVVIKNQGTTDYIRNGRIMSARHRTLGDNVRKKIGNNVKRQQIKWAADQGYPTILLVYDYESGLEIQDLETAMFGEYTLLVDKFTGKNKGGIFHGKKGKLQKGVNTSFSAVGVVSSFSGYKPLIVKNLPDQTKIVLPPLPNSFKVINRPGPPNLWMI